MTTLLSYVPDLTAPRAAQPLSGLLLLSRL